jgi:hypothetical protein
MSNRLVFAVFRGQDGHVPQQRFMVAEHDDGNRSIVLEGTARLSA